MHIHTDRIGHPLLVKVSYHPRWRADGADGPYLVSPALMMVVPRRHDVRLYYARNASDHLGLALSLGALGLGRVDAGPAAPPSPPGAGRTPPAPRCSRGWRRRPIPTARRCSTPATCPGRPAAGEGPCPPRCWWRCPWAGWPPRRRPPDVDALHAKATRAYAEGRFADAAEYARHAAEPARGRGLRPALLLLRGESLLRAGQPGAAADVLEGLIAEADKGPLVPRALFGAAQARTA